MSHRGSPFGFILLEEIEAEQAFGSAEQIVLKIDLHNLKDPAASQLSAPKCRAKKRR